MSKYRYQMVRLIKNEYVLLSVILVVSVLLRLYKIDNPIADWHSWRQADTASVARIYKNEGVRLLYPRYYDISTIQTGIFNPRGYRFVELPIYNALHAVFGEAVEPVGFEVSGRLLSVIISAISLYFVYLLGKKFMGIQGGLLSALVFAILPFNIYFSRVILPEPLSVSLALAALWLFLKDAEEEKTLYLLSGAMLFSLAILVKPFVFFYILPVVYLLIKRDGFANILIKSKNYVATAVVIAPFIVWRWWESNFPEGIPFWDWVFNGDGIRFKPAFWYWIFGERIGSLLLGVWGVVPVFYAIVNFRKGKEFLWLFLSSAILYLILVASANVKHDYYQIVVVPAIVLVLTYGILELWESKVFNKFLVRTVLLMISITALITSAFQVKEFYKINRPEIIKAGLAVERLAEKDALVIAPYNGDTAFLYQTNRSGWPYRDRSLDELIEKGADYYISVDMDDNTKEAIDRFGVYYRDSRFVIIKLNRLVNL